MVALLLVAAVVTGVVGGGLLFHFTGEGRILRGVSIAGVPVGGLTRSEATEVVARLEKEVLRKAIQVVGPSHTWDLVPREVGFAVDREATVDRAFAIGRTGSIPARFSAWRRLYLAGIEVDPVTTVDDRLLREQAIAWADHFRRQPRNAHLDARTGRVSQEEAGSEMDFRAALAAVRRALKATGDRRLVQLPVRTLLPRVTKTQLAAVKAGRVLGRFSTRFDPTDGNRTHNIGLSAAAIDGLILKAGEVFSFNRVVGPRTAERGFKAAPEIIREKFVTGIGGGVCQVSSTLYNAVLNSGLAIVARTNHSQPLGYVQVGLDATVYYGLIDFRFRNNLESPVVLAADISDDVLTISVCGQNADSPEVRVQVGAIEPVEPAEEVEEEDPTLAPGTRVKAQEPKIGYRVEVWRVFYRNNREVGRERISRDYYRPRPLIWKVGPKSGSASGEPKKAPPKEEKTGAQLTEVRGI